MVINFKILQIKRFPVDNHKEEKSTIPYEPTEADLKWLNREENSDLAPIQFSRLYVPRKIFKRVLIRTIFAVFMVWPVVPYAVNTVMEPIQKKATLEQLSPNPEQRKANKLLTNFEPFTIILIGELVTIGIWAYLVIPEFVKVYKFNKKYDM